MGSRAASGANEALEAYRTDADNGDERERVKVVEAGSPNRLKASPMKLTK